jgi:chorismate mutase/prephenate dehydrogenase
MGGSDADLAHLRERLAALDRELVRLVAQRMAVVREIAAHKLESELPAFDRAREVAHLSELVDAAGEDAATADAVRELWASLFAASRRVQREAALTRLERVSVGIVGGTAGMGAFLARVLGRAGFPVETTGLDAGAPARELAARHDLVVIAVPIAATLAVIEQVAPHVRTGACLCDVTSLKVEPLRAMLQHAPAGVDVVGTHPMFGPRGDDCDRQKVVLCRGRGEAGFRRIKRLFEALGAETLEATAAEHDAQMAVIQVLVHAKTMVLGSALAHLHADLARSLDFASPIYRTELAMIGRMFSQRADLYAEILTSNPHAPRIGEALAHESTRLARALADSDRAAIVARFDEVAAYMAEFAAWARRQSDAILEHLVRHG